MSRNLIVPVFGRPLSQWSLQPLLGPVPKCVLSSLKLSLATLSNVHFVLLQSREHIHSTSNIHQFLAHLFTSKYVTFTRSIFYIVIETPQKNVSVTCFNNPICRRNLKVISFEYQTFTKSKLYVRISSEKIPKIPKTHIKHTSDLCG